MTELWESAMDKNVKHIIFTVEETVIPFFFFFLQRGFGVDTTINCTVKSLLCHHLGIAPDYLATRIQTIFIDGKTVDDVNGAIVREGNMLTLSAAMPGVLGAMLRKGGHYAVMRSGISHKESGVIIASKKGRIHMKLFNLITEELGLHFLDRGIWIKGKDLKSLLARKVSSMAKACKSVFADGNEYDCGEALHWDWNEADEVFLQVKVYAKGDEKERAE